MVKPYYLRRLEREHARLAAYLRSFKAAVRREWVKRLYYQYNIRKRVERERLAEAITEAIMRAIRRGDFDFLLTRLTGIRDPKLRRRIREDIRAWFRERESVAADVAARLEALQRVAAEEAFWRANYNHIIAGLFVMYTASRAKWKWDRVEREMRDRGIPEDVIRYLARWWLEFWGSRHKAFASIDFYELCHILKQMAEVHPTGRVKINVIICSPYGIDSFGRGQRTECVTERIWNGRLDEFDCERVADAIAEAAERWGGEPQLTLAYAV